MCMRRWAWKPSPSTVAQSVINEILNIVRWPLASLDSHLFSINSCPAIDKGNLEYQRSGDL